MSRAPLTQSHCRCKFTILSDIYSHCQFQFSVLNSQLTVSRPPFGRCTSRRGPGRRPTPARRTVWAFHCAPPLSSARPAGDPPNHTASPAFRQRLPPQSDSRCCTALYRPLWDHRRNRSHSPCRDG